MSILSKSTIGIKPSADITCIYGEGGIGKTHFAAKYPNVFFIDLDSGSRKHNVRRLENDTITDYTTLIAVVDELFKEPVSAVVIDTVTQLEKYIHAHICKKANVESIEQAYGGFQKGLVASAEELTKLMYKLQQLRDTGKEILLLGHTKQKSHTDAHELVTYERNSLTTDERFAQVIYTMCDNVYFVKAETAAVRIAGHQKKMGVQFGEKRMYTEYRASAYAKNRKNLPYEIPFDYDEYQKAVLECKPRAASAILASIEALIKALPEASEEIASRALAAAKSQPENTDNLIRIEKKLKELTPAA